MKAACTLLAVATLLSGCQSAGRSAAPRDLDVRLRAVESARRNGEREQQGPLPDGRGSDRHARSLGWVPRPLRSKGWGLTSGHVGGSPHPFLAGKDGAPTVWTLSDIGDDPAGSGATDDDLVFDTDRSDGEEKYTRRRPLSSFWETVERDVRDAPRDLWRDTKRVYGSPTNLVILGTTFGGALALRQTGPDRSVERHFLREGPFGTNRVHRHMSTDWRDAFATAGNPGTHFALAGLFYLIGQQTGDDKTYEVGKTLFSALTINGVTVLLGQAATRDRSPNGELGTIPSGHTSSAFVVASVLHEAYGHAVGIPLYGLAALVAQERLESNEHYLADVVMGAVLGTVVGHSVASGREPEFFGWKLHPWASPTGGTGIAFVKTLP